MKLLPSLVALGSLSLGTSLLTAQVLLNDTFADGDRTTQSLPDSAAWFGSSASSISVVPGGLQIAGGRAITAYFAPSGSPVTLANPGDSLVLTYEVAYSAATDPTSNASLKLALANSNGAARVTADAVNNVFDPYSSYVVSYGYATSVIFRARAPDTGNTALLTSMTGYSNIGSGATLALVDEPVPYFYLATFSITRNDANGLDLSYTLTDMQDPSNTWVSLITDTTPVTFAFDTLSFGNTTGNDMQIGNIKLEFVTVPEPSTYALMAGAAVSLLLIARRRRS